MSTRVLTFGEAMLRLSVPVGRRFEQVASFDVHPAGSEANVAVALAQLGLDVAWYSRLPKSALARRISSEMAIAGVDLSLVTWVEGGRLGVFYVELSAPPRPISIIYDRAGSTASEMSGEDYPWEALGAADLIHVSGITPAISSSCRQLTSEVIKRAAEVDTRVSVDVNFRSKLWDPGTAREWFDSVSGLIDLLMINNEDARDVFGITGEGALTVERLQEELKAANVVLSSGSDGAIWKADGSAQRVPARESTVVDRIGAGDAFAAGVIAGYVDGDLGGGVEMGIVMASLILGLNGDFLKTSRREVTRLVEASGRSVDR